MTFQQLYYLLEVEKTGSFSAAARNMYVTQSTISNAVAGLEKEVGGPIFVRGKKALTLTPEGEKIMAHAKRICESHKYITTGERTQNPVVRIGSNGFSPVRTAFVRLVEENRDRDDLRFVYQDGRNKSFEEELLASRMDVAVAMFTGSSVMRKEESFRQRGLCYEKLITLPGAICIGPGHRLYNVPEFSLEELKNDRFIQLTAKAVMRNYMPVNVEKNIVTTHPEARRELLHRGLGYIITYMHSAVECEATKLRYIELPGVTYTFYVFYDSLHPKTPEVKRFLTLLKEEVSKYTL